MLVSGVQPRNLVHTYTHTHQASLVAQTVKNAGDPASVPGLGRSPGEGNGNPLQDSCLEHSIDRVAWEASPWGGKVRHD